MGPEKGNPCVVYHSAVGYATFAPLYVQQIKLLLAPAAGNSPGSLPSIICYLIWALGFEYGSLRWYPDTAWALPWSCSPLWSLGHLFTTAVIKERFLESELGNGDPHPFKAKIRIKTSPKFCPASDSKYAVKGSPSPPVEKGSSTSLWS